MFVNAAYPIMEIVAPNYVAPIILEIGITQFAALAGTYGLGRPAVAGVGPRLGFALQSEDPTGPATLTTAYLDWSVPPTVPAVFIRRATLVAALGTGIIWAFPTGLRMGAATTMVIWGIASCPACDMWVMVDE